MIRDEIRCYAERVNPGGYFVGADWTDAEAEFVSRRTGERMLSESQAAEDAWAGVLAVVAPLLPAGWSGSFEHTGGGCYALAWRPQSDPDGEGPVVMATIGGEFYDVLSSDDTPATVAVYAVGGLRTYDDDSSEMFDTDVTAEMLPERVAEYVHTLTA